MDRKVKNTLLLFMFFLLLSAGGVVYAYIIQKDKIEEKRKTLNELRTTALDTKELMKQLAIYRERADHLDSLLTLRNYIIPEKLAQTTFYNFVTKTSTSFHPMSFVNIEYLNTNKLQHYEYYTYKVSGTTEYNDFFKLIYAIENSKQIKKIYTIAVDNFVKVEDEGMPHYLVTFAMEVYVYYAATNRFTTKNIRENDLRAVFQYDVFYPLIRNEIPPNTDNLLDVQTAELLALIPDGAYLTDGSGNTHLLWEGDKVYLGYLTKIDYKSNSVDFILNKGGIIETKKLTIGESKKNGGYRNEK